MGILIIIVIGFLFWFWVFSKLGYAMGRGIKKTLADTIDEAIKKNKERGG